MPIIPAVWGVWDAARGPKIGSYGFIDLETGAMDVQGNVYDPAFQRLVDECDGIQIGAHPPVYADDPIKPGGPVMTSMWVRPKEFAAPADAPPGVDAASTKGQWWFHKGKSCVVLLMHEPREQVLPGPALEELFKGSAAQAQAPRRQGGALRRHGCVPPALPLFWAHVTLALRGSDKSGSGELEWYTQGCETGVSPTGALSAFTPLFTLKLKYPLIRSLLRDNITPDPRPEDYWCMTFPPWQPLDDEGIQVPDDDEPDASAAAAKPAARVYDLGVLYASVMSLYLVCLSSTDLQSQ